MTEAICVHLADGERKIGGPRCGRPSTHMTPLGLHCAPHARQVAEAAHAPRSLLGILLAARLQQPLPSVDEMMKAWKL